MKVEPVKTQVVRANEISIEDLIAQSIPKLPEKSILAITSKVVALSEGRIVDKPEVDKEKLIQHESDYYMPVDFGRYGFHFTITRNTLISMSGIDESNADDTYVLWPANPQETANRLRQYLQRQFSRDNVGVLIIDSTCLPPMRRGTVGIMLAHSGFRALQDLSGTPDLFGRNFQFSQLGVGSGLAAAANVVMGEGAQQTPLAIISEVPLVEFTPNDPTAEEIEATYIASDEDLYAPFINSVKWKKGGGGASKAASGKN